MLTEDLSVFPVEIRNKELGTKEVQSVRIELSENIGSKIFTGLERSDWFKGLECTMTVAQAKHLHGLLGRCIHYMEALEGKGSNNVER
ncbi:MAG: hypothetical protein EOO52_13225 [Gammaproteobacteria bacterium]|nr:MAG: hypothetical protein EOO52_13225 [Gammaproteobacteria bacterium]